MIEELIGDAFHNTDQYASNRVECHHGRLKARLRPMRGLNTDQTASGVVGGHTFMQTCVATTANSVSKRERHISESQPLLTTSPG